MLDLQSEFGQRASRRLDQELIIWLASFDRQGTPPPRPVWFLWNGASQLAYTRPGTAKIEPIRRNPQVALHFDGD